MYHELVPVLSRQWCSHLLAASLCFALACADDLWGTVSWPSDQPGTPRQPVLDAAELGLAVRATALTYEPEAVSVALVLENRGASQLRVEPSAITLAWDQLEYAVAGAVEPAWIELAPAARAKLRLRYHLGRPLTGPGSTLILRSVTCDGVAVVELPQLELPAMPAR